MKAGIELYDAAIVGAGPVGSYVASSLASRGHRVLVVEEHEKAGEAVCCTGIIGKECLDTFPADGSVILREAKSARFFSPSGETFRVSKETTQACIIDRGSFDSLWASRAQEEGSDYLWSSRVTDIDLKGKSVRITVANGQKENTLISPQRVAFGDPPKERAFESKTVVIASGFGSGLPEKLGLDRIGDFVMGAQAEVEADGIEEVEIHFGRKIAPDFFAWLVPTSPGKALAGLLSRRDTGSHLKDFLSNLQTQGKIACPEVRISYGAIPLKPLPRTYGDRVLVVGDAAGQVKPTTGGGIYYGLLCARIAADTLHQALSADDFLERTLALYEKKWQKRLGREIKADRWARRFFERLSDEQIDRMFRIIESRGLHQTLLESEDFSFDWHGGLIREGLKHLGLQGAMQMTHALLSRRLFRSPA